MTTLFIKKRSLGLPIKVVNKFPKRVLKIQRENELITLQNIKAQSSSRAELQTLVCSKVFTVNNRNMAVWCIFYSALVLITRLDYLEVSVSPKWLVLIGEPWQDPNNK